MHCYATHTFPNFLYFIWGRLFQYVFSIMLWNILCSKIAQFLYYCRQIFCTPGTVTLFKIHIYKTELLSQKYKLKPVVRVVIFTIHTAIMWDAFQGLQCKYVGSWGCRSGNESFNSKIYTDGKFLIQECQ